MDAVISGDHNLRKKVKLEKYPCVGIGALPRSNIDVSGSTVFSLTVGNNMFTDHHIYLRGCF